MFAKVIKIYKNFECERGNKKKKKKNGSSRLLQRLTILYRHSLAFPVANGWKYLPRNVIAADRVVVLDVIRCYDRGN